MMKKMMCIFTACLMLTASLSFAFSFQDWINKINRRKPRRSAKKQTMVAAVRGIDDPGQVNPEARNFEGVKWMEEKSFSKEEVAEFMTQGKLALIRSEKGAGDVQKK